MRMSPSLTENCFPCVLIVAFISSKGRNKVSLAGVIKDLFTFSANHSAKLEFIPQPPACESQKGKPNEADGSRHQTGGIAQRGHFGHGKVAVGQGFSAYNSEWSRESPDQRS